MIYEISWYTIILSLYSNAVTAQPDAGFHLLALNPHHDHYPIGKHQYTAINDYNNQGRSWVQNDDRAWNVMAREACRNYCMVLVFSTKLIDYII